MLVPQNHFEHNLNFDNNRTNIRVIQQPGGNSNFSLGWTKEPVNNKNNYIQKVIPYQEDLKVENYMQFPKKIPFKETSPNINDPFIAQSPYYTDPYPRPYLFNQNREKETHEQRYRQLVEESLRHYQDIVRDSPLTVKPLSMRSPIETAYMRFSGRELCHPYFREPEKTQYSFRKPQYLIDSKPETPYSLYQDRQPPSVNQSIQIKPRENKISPFQMNYQNIVNNFDTQKPHSQPSSHEAGRFLESPTDLRTGKKIIAPPGN